MAGFLKSEGSYLLPRAAYKPPASLQMHIWPWLERWLERVRARGQGKGWKAGGIAADDRASVSFLELLAVRLRTARFPAEIRLSRINSTL